MIFLLRLFRVKVAWMAKGTPWEELKTHHCGWWTEVGTTPTVEALYAFLTLNEKEIEIMGRNERKQVEEKYSVEAVASDFEELYQWILTQKHKPEFVYE